MDTLWFAMNAVFPIVFVIALGYYLSRIRFYDDQFLKSLNKLVFFVGLPTLLFYNIYNIDSISNIDIHIIWIALIAGFIIFLAGFLVVSLFVEKANRKGVVLQCIFRSNFAIIGLPLATALGGPEATAIASLLSAFTIPFLNFLAVLSLTIFMTNGEKMDKKRLIINVMKNPLIVGVFFGIIALLVRELLSINADGPRFTIKEHIPFLYEAIRMVAIIASPVALIVLGGQFRFKAIGSMFKDIAIGVLGRLVLAPILGFMVLYLFVILLPGFELKSAYIPGLIALYGSPVAVSSAVMAQQMKGDEMLASQLVIWTSLVSIFTIFGLIVIFRSMGLL